MRASVFQKNPIKAAQTLKDIETLLDETGYFNRFYNYDIVLGWYYYILREPKKTPDWLKGQFSSVPNTIFLENFGNQIKARYHYLTKNYLPLLSYIKDMKQRESVLYGRVELLAIEACIHYQMKNKDEAWKVFKEAYDTAYPNNIIMPFIELGKDMRTLTISALCEKDSGIPNEWLEKIRHESLYYARNQSMFITSIESEKNNNTNATFSPREYEILSDLYNGLSQKEIAAKRKIALNTVKMNMKRIYSKLDVHRVTDLIRVVAEQHLV